MPDELGSAALGATVEWRLYNPRRKETRTFEQGELSIEGEARLIGLARKFGTVLGEAGYTFGELGALMDGEGATDWPKALGLIEAVASFAPDLVADAVTVLFGIFPTNEDGTPAADYEDTRLFLRGAVNSAKVNDIFRAFIALNQYARLVGPFSATLAEAMDAYAAPAASASSAASGPLAIVGTDGSVVALETSESEATTTTEPKTSETATPSGVSRPSRKRASADPAPSGAS